MVIANNLVDVLHLVEVQMMSVNRYHNNAHLMELNVWIHKTVLITQTRIYATQILMHQVEDANLRIRNVEI